MRSISRFTRVVVAVLVVVAALGHSEEALAQWGGTYAFPSTQASKPLDLGIEGRDLPQEFSLRSLGPDVPKPKSQDLTPHGAYGLSIEGNVTYAYANGLLRLRVDRVSNHNATRTSGTLRLVVWFSTDAFPAYGYRTAIYAMGQLQPNYYYYDIDSGYVAFVAPPTGCYNVTVVLEEWSGSEWLYVDYVATTPKQGINMICGPTTSCTPNATTLCMLGGRFKVRLRYRNQYSNPPAEGYLNARSFANSATTDSAVFWFSDDKNIEYLVKVYDVRPHENKIHVGMGAVTDIETWLEITDTTNNRSREYHKGPGLITGLFDRASFDP